MIISTTPELLAALRSAKPGQTLALASRTFSTLGIERLKFAREVVIASADPANPATVQGMEIDDCEGFIFRDLKVRLNRRTQTVCNVTHSARVRLDRLDLADTTDSPNNGLLFRWCRDVAVSRTRFHDCGNAVRNVDSVGVTVEGCDFRNIQGDGIQTTGCSSVRLSGNSFTDFYPGPGDHPDAMQFFTLNQTAPAREILIEDNVITRGKGGIVQGIFLGNEAGIPYQEVKILGNALAGTMYNGIALGNGQDVTIQNNFVQPYADMGSWIRLDEISGLELGGNEVTNVALKGCRGVRDRGFKRIGPAPVGDERRLRAWIAARTTPVKQSLLGGLDSNIGGAAVALGVANAALDDKKNRRGVLASLLVGLGRLVGPLR
jgi:hypothetical protein